MQYLLVARDPNGRSLTAETADTDAGREEVLTYFREDLGAASVAVYTLAYVLDTPLDKSTKV